MARPQKQGLDYFSFDVSFFQDIRIRKLIKYHGIQAVPVYEIILCSIYENGYYLEWDDDLPFTISEISHLEEDTILNIFNYCVEVGLFNKEVFDQHHIITSRSIQQRYITACSLTHRKISTNSPYLLVSVTQEPVKSEKTPISSEQTLVFSEETPISSEETPVNSEKSTQIKEKERKIKHSSSADIRAREDESGTWSGDDLKTFADVDAEVAELRNSPIWKEQVFMRFKFLGCNEAMLNEYLERFASEQKIGGKKGHQHLGDAKKHFSNWMIVQEDKYNKKRNSNGAVNNNGYRSREDTMEGAMRNAARLIAEGREPYEPLPVV